MTNRFSLTYNSHHALLILCMLLFSCASLRTKSGIDVLNAVDLKPYGRYLFNNDKQLELISSAVHFGFSFEGKECTINASNFSRSGHNYIQYELDGVYQRRIKITG